MAYLAVLTADGGIPIFTRSSSDIKTKLPFATVGALNGVHLFSRLRNSELKSAVTLDEKIIWKEYRERLVLILITRDDETSDCHLHNLLDNIFAAIAMLVGMDSLLSQGEVIRLQKSLVICHPLIDYLLNDKQNIGNLTCTTECILTADSHPLQDCMSQFLDVADSLYGCLSIKGNIVICSKEWWTLTNQERVLICSYINCFTTEYSKEVIIYLPTSSPKNPNRLVILNLLKDVQVCVLCTNDPPLPILVEESRKTFLEYFGLLKTIANLHPRNIPSDIELDKNILSLLLINVEKSQSVCCLQSNSIKTIGKSTTCDSLVNQQEPLKVLYKLVTGIYLQSKDSDCESANSNPEKCIEYTSPVFFKDEHFQVAEFYMYLDDHKCYVINEFPYHLYIIFKDDIPKYATRSVAHRSLKILTERNLFPQT